MKLSENIIEIPIDEGLLIYHRWFGNPIVVNLTLFDKLKSSNISELPFEFTEELYSLGFLIENNSNEYELFKNIAFKNIEPSTKGKKIKQLDLIVSEGCNLGCPHCIYYAGNSRKIDSNSYMSFDTALKSWETYLITARGNNIEEFEVHFGGAEPLTNWDLVKLILLNFPNSLKENETINWSINTNVTLVTNEIAKKLGENKVIIHTSIDGNKEANDKIRMKLGGQGTFDLICDKIILLRKYGAEVSDISTTITDANYDLINLDFINWLSEFGIKGFGVDIDLVSCASVSSEQATKKITDIFWKCYELNIECSGTWMTPFLNIINKDLRTEHVAFCGAVRGQNISVTPKGELKLCPYMSTKIGQLNNWSSMFEDNSDFQTLLFERQPSADITCSGCILEGPCGGQCHITREESKRNNNYNSYNLMCDFYRKVTTTMLTQYCNFNSVHPINI